MGKFAHPNKTSKLTEHIHAGRGTSEADRLATRPNCSLSLSLSSCLVFATLISGVILASTTASADDSFVSDVSITVKESCTFKGIFTNPHTASVNDGTVTSDIGTTTLKAFCNDSGGFAIYAIGYTNEEYGNTMLSSQTIGSSADIATGPATSGDTSNWAMKLATDSSATYPIALDNGFGSYSAVPSAYTQVASRASGTDLGTEATGATLTTTYQTYIASDQPADTYLGKVKYTMVHPSSYEPNMPHTTAAGNISYYPNGNGKVADTMGDQEAESNAEVVLWPSNFQRPGYGFAGWNTEFDMSGTNYGPMETITTPDLTTEGLSLYANWIKSAGTMQGWTGCSNMNIGDVTALTDNRDGNTYAVAKLADGKCWMIENLRLENTNFDNATGNLAQGYNASFAGLAAPEIADFSNSTTANSLYSIDNGTNKTILGDYQGYRFPRYRNDNTNSDTERNPNTTIANMTSTDQNIYSYGNYYSWAAAIADTTHYNTNNQSVSETSICPTGWHLPTGGQATVNTTADFYTLGKSLMKDSKNNSIEPNQNASDGYGYYDNTLTNMNGDTATEAFRKFPNNFLYSGTANGSNVTRGNVGYYWSSTVHGNSNAYSMFIGGTRTYPATYYNSSFKYYGRTVRCIASTQ